MIKMDGIAKSVILPGNHRLEILKSVDLEVSRGEVVAILGRSGSGKSTLLNIIGLLDNADAGSYELNGVDVNALHDARRSELRGSTFGFVFQTFMLFERRTAIANVSIPMSYGSADTYRHRESRALAVLSSVGLREKSSVLPNRLSGGEQQRIAIARALARDPECILADEPTGSLDIETATGVLELLHSIVRNQARSLIIITHDPAIAAMADRRLFLSNGILSAL